MNLFGKCVRLERIDLEGSSIILYDNGYTESICGHAVGSGSGDLGGIGFRPSAAYVGYPIDYMEFTMVEKANSEDTLVSGLTNFYSNN